MVEKSLVGFGGLDAIHLALCLTHCGYPTDLSCAGTNGELGCSWIAPVGGVRSQGAVARAHARSNTLLEHFCPGAMPLQVGEAQALLCVFIYAAQSFLTGSNALHPRLCMGVIQASSRLGAYSAKVRERRARLAAKAQNVAMSVARVRKMICS